MRGMGLEDSERKAGMSRIRRMEVNRRLRALKALAQPGRQEASVRERSIAMVQNTTENLTLLVLASDAEPQLRADVVRRIMRDTDPWMTHALAMGTFTAYIQAISQLSGVSPADLMNLYGQVSSSLELAPDVIHMHPSHPSHHKEDPRGLG